MRRLNLLYLAGVLVITLGFMASPTAGWAAYGDWLSTISTGLLNQPAKVAVDSANGDVYVTDAGNMMVKKYDRTGTYISAFSLSVSGTPVGLAVNSTNIFVGDSTNKCVWIYNKSGALTDLAGTGTSHKLGGASGTALTMPNTVTVAPSGQVFVVDGDSDKAYIYNSDGTMNSNFCVSGLTASANGSTTINVYYPIGLTMANSTNLSGIVTQYFYLGDQGNYRVYKLHYAYNAISKAITTVPTVDGVVGLGKGDGFGYFLRVSDLAWDGYNSRLIVSDSLQQVAQQFDCSNNTVGTTMNAAFNYSGGAVQGYLNIPTGCALDASNQWLYVVNNQGNNLVKFNTAACVSQPTLTGLSPSGNVVQTTNPLTINYTAGAATAGTIYLFYDTNTAWSGGSKSLTPGTGEGLIGTASVAAGAGAPGSINWQVIRMTPGIYYVRGVVVDSNGCSTELYSTGNVTINDSGNGLNSIFVATYGACMGALSGPNDDPDNDGLTNIQEQQYGTNPCVADTDGDGIRDGVEVAKGTDPTNPLDGTSSTPDQTLPFYNKGQTPEMYMSKVVVSNYGSTALKSDLLFYDQAGGNYTVSYPVDLPAYGSKEFDLAVDTPSATIEGSIELRSTSTSETGFVKIIRQNATDNTTWDLMSFFNFYPPTFAGTTNQIFYYNTAQIAGNHYQCYLIGRNMTNSAITGTAHMYNMDGSDTGLTANLSGAAHSNIIYSPVWTTGAPAQGVCKIAASGNMTGIATFFKQTETNLNWSDFAACVDYEFGYNTASVLYGPFDSNDVVGGVVTWIIVNNPNAVPVNMLVTYYDQAGNTLGTVTANNILPHANSIFNPSWATAIQKGSFTISTKDTSNNPISAAGLVAMQYHSATDINTDLYANALNLLAQPGKVLTISDFNKTALWKTLITLLNTSGSSVTATVKFYDRNGGLNASVPVTLNAHGSTVMDVSTPAYNVTVNTGSIIVQEPTGSVIATLCETHTNPSTCTVNPSIEDAGEGVQFLVIQ